MVDVICDRTLNKISDDTGHAIGNVIGASIGDVTTHDKGFCVFKQNRSSIEFLKVFFWLINNLLKMERL